LAITGFQQVFQQIMKNFSTQAAVLNVQKVVDMTVEN
jgi:hypothetical protein